MDDTSSDVTDVSPYKVLNHRVHELTRALDILERSPSLPEARARLRERVEKLVRLREQAFAREQAE